MYRNKNVAVQRNFNAWRGKRSNQFYLHQARTQGGCRGYIPPTRPKEVLIWHLIWLKIIAKNIFVLHITIA